MNTELGDFFSNTFTNKPFVIAGPCSAESAEQMHDTVELLSQQNVKLVRAGIWKPRTRPNSFEGRGTVALQWLKDAGTKFNLPVAVEVATVEHVEQALRAEIDVLWIGARTTVNPFMVQEIAYALRGVNIPVMVKNPINPDLELWLGSVERICKAGITQVSAIHRGFSSYENSLYRYKPNWEIPIEFKRQRPEVPMICDPSHIAGNTENIFFIAQTALDLQYDGLMIETHINPKEALSDAKQQITPHELELLLSKLMQRKSTPDDVFELTKLLQLREKIDALDKEMIDVLARRMEISRIIGSFKKENNVTILQPERWDEIIKSRTAYGTAHELHHEFLLKLCNILHEESIMQQANMMNATENPELKK